MIPTLIVVKVCLATGHTDMRKGFNGFGLQVWKVLRRDSFSGHAFFSRVRKGDRLKVA